MAGNRKPPAQNVELCGHPEEQSEVVLIRLSSQTYYIPTTHHKAQPGEILIQAVRKHT